MLPDHMMWYSLPTFTNMVWVTFWNIKGQTLNLPSSCSTLIKSSGMQFTWSQPLVRGTTPHHSQCECTEEPQDWGSLDAAPQPVGWFLLLKLHVDCWICNLILNITWGWGTYNLQRQYPQILIHILPCLHSPFPFLVAGSAPLSGTTYWGWPCAIFCRCESMRIYTRTFVNFRTLSA